MKKSRIIFILSIVTILLLIPFVAGLITDAVNWNLSDYVIMGILLSGTGFLCDFVLRKVNGTNKKMLFCIVILLIFLFIWLELAVGIF